MALVDALVEDPAWDAVGLDDLAETAAAATLRHLGLDPAGYEISLLGCDDARIADLNAEFRGKPAPTNVLSWPSAERSAAHPGAMPVLPEPGQGMPAELGDIAIAHATCAREATVAGMPLRQHVTHLVVHGVLHLLGFDHIHDADAELMERIESAILTGMALPDPYAGSPKVPLV
jgi:probable rRNA maturation factor